MPAEPCGQLYKDILFFLRKQILAPKIRYIREAFGQGQTFIRGGAVEGRVWRQNIGYGHHGTLKSPQWEPGQAALE